MVNNRMYGIDGNLQKNVRDKLKQSMHGLTGLRLMYSTDIRKPGQFLACAYTFNKYLIEERHNRIAICYMLHVIALCAILLHVVTV